MRSTKLCGGILLAVVCTLFPSVVFAAPTKLPTSFNPDRHVYVTPGTNVPVTGMEKQVQRSAVPTFVVFTSQGDEAFTADLALDQTARLLQIWSVQNGWPKDRYLVIIAVQNKLHAEIFCTNIAVGAGLTRLGITDAELKAVLNDANKFVAVNPNDFALSITQGVADLIDQHGGNPGGNQGGGGDSSANGKTLLIVGAIVAGLVVVGIIIFLIVRKKQKEAARQATLRKLAEAAGLKADVESTARQLESVGLSFQPFQGQLSHTDNLVSQARQTLDRDPEQAESLANQACEKLTTLLGRLKRAIELKTDTTLDGAIGAARTKVSETRTQSVNFNYPGENASVAERLLLNEPGCNPDEFLTQADRERNAISPALTQGDVDGADGHWHAGRTACTGALSCIERTLSEKQRVETQMGSVIQQCTEFDNDAAQKVKEAYFAQQFVHAAQLMDALKQLIADRAQARAIVARCAQLQRQVGERLQQNERYVSAGTDDKFARLTTQLDSLNRSVNQPTGDWSTLRSSAEQVESQLNLVDQEITGARAAYDGALKAVQLLRAKIEAADFPDANDRHLTGPSRDKLVAISDLIERLEAHIRLSKQDWAAISQEANEGTDQIEDLKKMLVTDTRHWQEIVERGQLIDRLGNGELYTVTLDGRVYNGGVALAVHDRDFTLALSQAHQHLDAAQGCWKRRSFDELARELGEYLQPQLITLHLVGWWSVGQMMRDSDDLAAQHYGFQVIGYRDETTWQLWRDKFIVKQRVDANGIFWPQDVAEWKRTGAGGADLTQAPDFKGYGGSDPWTPPTPTVAPQASA